MNRQKMRDDKNNSVDRRCDITMIDGDTNVKREPVKFANRNSVTYDFYMRKILSRHDCVIQFQV